MSVTRPSHCIVSTVRDAQFDEMLCILVASESAVCRIHSTNRAYARDAVSNNLYRGGCRDRDSITITMHTVF